MAKLLLVEDDFAYSALICDYLKSCGHVIDTVSTVADGLEFLRTYEYDLLIVDWHLPDAGGPELIRKLRQQGNPMPMLMLTRRDQLGDKEEGFESGADDYLSKDVHPRELNARITALLRRQPVYKDSVIRLSDTLELNLNDKTVRKNGIEVHLQSKEFALLAHLARHPDRTFSADQLLERLWSAESDVTIHSVRSCINKIRTKLEDPEGPPLIVTKYKAGYQLNRT